jgi:hypothetical protein
VPTALATPTTDLVCIRIDRRRAGSRWWSVDDRMVFAIERAMRWFPGSGGLTWIYCRCARVPASIVEAVRDALGDDRDLLVVTKVRR